MDRLKSNPFWSLLSVMIVVVVVFPVDGEGTGGSNSPDLNSLLPKLKDWKMTEQPSNYLPANLFEYINGAAEIYLAYAFKELAVAQYGREESEVNVAVEIYEMSSEVGAFGIYSAERFPDNNFIQVGVQGYMEEGTLNYLIGRYYIKLLCFEGGDQSEEYLNLFAKTIADNSRGHTDFPGLLKHFPKKAIVANSEKFIMKNVMGYRFLHDGYSAEYRMDDFEFDCFIIQGIDEDDALLMMDKYLEAKKEQPVQKMPSGFVIQDRYYDNIYLAKVGRHLCGVKREG